MRLKYYLRGLGIGIICTTLVLSVEFHAKGSSMSDAEIIQRAEELGMIQADNTKGEKNNDKGLQTSQKEQENDSKAVETNAKQTDANASKEAQKNQEKKESSTAAGIATSVQANEKTSGSKKTQKTDSADSSKSDMVVFEIHEGETSDAVAQNLFNSALVDNAEAFNDYVVDGGYDSRFQIGQFSIPKGSSYEEIAKILTKKQP